MGGSQCEPTGVTPQLGVGGARYPGSQLPVHHSLHTPVFIPGQSLSPFGSGYSGGGLGTCLLPGEGVGVTRETSAAWGEGSTAGIQIFWLTGSYCTWRPGMCGAGLHLQSPWVLLRMGMIEDFLAP